MPPRPPTSTLFPYTTLFRSGLKTPSTTRTNATTPRYWSYDESKISARGGASGSPAGGRMRSTIASSRSEEHTSELQSQFHLVCRLLLEKKKKYKATLTVESR